MSLRTWAMLAAAVSCLVACQKQVTGGGCVDDRGCDPGELCQAGACVPVGGGGTGGGGSGGSGGTGGTGGTGGEGTTFRCEPAELDFGNVLRGSVRTLTVSCHNESAADGVLFVQPVRGEDAALFVHPVVVDGGRVAVAGGESVEIPVTYRADRSGAASAWLEIDDATRASVARVTLKARTVGHAITCSPTVLDFGFVMPESAGKHLSLVCTNAASTPFAITAVTLDPSSHQGVFRWAPNSYPLEIPGRLGNVEGSAILDVSFNPGRLDSGARRSGVLVVSTNDPTSPRFDVNMTGFAGGPVISCIPAGLDFGVAAKGLPVTRSFVCANMGTDDPNRSDDTLVVTRVETTKPAEFTATPREPLPAAGFAVGQTFTVDVAYNPTDDGLDNASAVIYSNAINATREGASFVSLTGSGRDLPPCAYDLLPAQLPFGIVEKGTTATLEFGIRNLRADAECLVQNLRLAPTCDPVFSLPGGEGSLLVVPPAGELRVPVSFSPRAYRATPYTCEVQFDISDPANPHRAVPLRGSSQEPCVQITPRDLDFGTVKPGCAARDREFQIINTCATPLVIHDIVLNEGFSDEFFIRSLPPPGTSITPGLAQLFTVAYRPEDEGVDLGSVLVHAQGTAEPYLATLRGRGALDAVQNDSFAQLDRPKVDVLWVIDNSSSMSEEQQAIGSNLQPFLSFAWAQQIDYQIGVTTSGLTGGGNCPGGAGGGEDGRLFPVDNSRPRIIKPGTANAEAVWAANVAVGTCQGQEYVLEAAFRALHPPLADNCDDPRHPEPNDGNCGFLRPNAHLSIIAVTDEVEQSVGTVNFYYNSFHALKGFGNPHLFSFHAITGDRRTGCSRVGTGAAEAGDRLIDLVERTNGGMFQSICATDWEASLRAMSAAAFGYNTCYTLVSQPEDTNGDGVILDTQGELRLELNGVVSPSRGPQGQQLWSYGLDQNSICFHPLATPEPGTQIDVTYRVACLAW